MLRKWMIGAAAAVAVAVGVGFSGQTANAAPPIVLQPSIGRTYQPPFPGPHGPGRHDRDFVLYVRHRGHWDFYGRYETRWQAERAERLLQRQGRQVRIEVVNGGRW